MQVHGLARRRVANRDCTKPDVVEELYED
jgi:hypothetical protein